MILAKRFSLQVARVTIRAAVLSPSPVVPTQVVKGREVQTRQLETFKLHSAEVPRCPEVVFRGGDALTIASACPVFFVCGGVFLPTSAMTASTNLIPSFPSSKPLKALWLVPASRPHKPCSDSLGISLLPSLDVPSLDRSVLSFTPSVPC